ncbi:GtrA family protein [Cyanobium sp. WAJ14-Wanaka]|nr:GtrA family protein [Cyanobium sp. WAJ14-Wanaka]
MRSRFFTWRPSGSGRKRRFGAAGVANVLVTNLLLQLLLWEHSLPAWLCTLTSQLVNGGIGYVLYGKWVFKASGLRQSQPALRYALSQALLWLLNWALISGGHQLALNRNFAALLAVPPLAVMSYLIQKQWIFRS